MQNKPSLYGIFHSNRQGNDLWGKNQFNGTLPVALACFMRDQGINPVYLSINENLEVVASEISFHEVFRVSPNVSNKELYFSFESKYEQYQKYAYDDIGNIDLVIKQGETYRRPLEIKLTVVPDDGTSKSDEKDWGPELVIRPATTIYAALGIADSLKESDMLNVVRSTIEPVCSDIRHWDSSEVISLRSNQILDAVDQVQKELFSLQKPLLMQTIWKTRGKKPILADNAFDIFIWSDFALCRLFLARSRQRAKPNGAVTRQMRSSARLARFLYEFSTREKVNIKAIYTEMAHNKQTDKEFAASGKVTREFMKSERRYNPLLKKNVLTEIILNGGEKLLSPERRFDATVCFTASSLFEDQ